MKIASSDRRPFLRGATFANVTSLLALVVSCSGTAYAALKITSADIVDKTIEARDVKSSTLTGDQIANGTIALSDLGPSARVLTASVGPECKLVRGSGVTDVSEQRTTIIALGGLVRKTECDVRFVRDVSRCVPVAGGGALFDSDVQGAIGSADSQPPQLRVPTEASGRLETNEVRVLTRMDGDRADFRPPTFHLAVFCSDARPPIRIPGGPALPDRGR